MTHLVLLINNRDAENKQLPCNETIEVIRPPQRSWGGPRTQEDSRSGAPISPRGSLACFKVGVAKGSPIYGWSWTTSPSIPSHWLCWLGLLEVAGQLPRETLLDTSVLYRATLGSFRVLFGLLCCFNNYMKPLEEAAWSFGVQCHQYADEHLTLPLLGSCFTSSSVSTIRDELDEVLPVSGKADQETGLQPAWGCPSWIPLQASMFRFQQWARVPLRSCN